MTYKKITIGVLAAVVMLVPSATHAATIAELQAYIQNLMSVVTSLQQQVAYQPTTNPYTNSYPYTVQQQGARLWWCDAFPDVRYGTYSNRVFQLQSAMGARILGTNPTGYYGPMTYNAVNRYCGQYSTGGGVVINNPANNYSCQSWNDGCNDCSRTYPGGPTSCTQRACIQQGTPYCTGYFGTNTNPTYNQDPVISSFYGPTVLNINQTGTWQVQARDPENGTLSYSVTWGDEYNYGYSSSLPYATNTSFTQSTSFTHSYRNAGTYTVSIVVRDNTGREARTTTTVRVNANTTTPCTSEYAPVCGQKPYYCPTGAYCTQVMPQQKTYSNTCMMNNDGATLVHYGTCGTYTY
jgi:hypothetical protein